MIQVLLAGEGRNELGDHSAEDPFRPERPQPGVLEALLRSVRPDGWQIMGAILWKKLPKLRVGFGKRGEEQNVRAAFHHARKRGAAVIVFSRDRDGPRFSHRHEDIERAISTLRAEHGTPAIVGAVAVEKLEAWLLAIRGERRSEEPRHPEERLAAFGVASKDTAAMVALVERFGLSAVPEDAASLRLWLTRAQEALAPASPP